MNELLFERDADNKLLEGPLGQEINLLIVLKEPNGEEFNCFWMKEQVLLGISGVRYYNVLGAFAKKILSEKTHRSALERCAYINLYPYNGKSTVNGGNYFKMMKVWYGKKLKDNREDAKLHTILNKRLQIFEEAFRCGVPILAHREIAAQIAKHFEMEYIGDYAKGYRSYSYKGVRMLYEMPHPAARLSYKRLSESLGISIYP